MQYVIVRCEMAGCFAGELESIDWATRVAVMRDARRLWSWAGAATLSELAQRGTSKPSECRFPAAVNITVAGVIEVIDVTPAARASIEGVPVWSA